MPMHRTVCLGARLNPQKVAQFGSKSIGETGTVFCQHMFQFTVALPSGQSETFSLPQSSKVGDLRVLAQKSFQRGFLRLVAADHSVVDPAVSLQATGLEDGDHLTAIAVEAKLAATGEAFALFCPGGDRVVTWGTPDSGGGSSEVQDRLKGVQQAQATGFAFAAILADGSVVTWGDPDYGGDSSEVQDQLKGVQQVHSNGSVCCNPCKWLRCDLGRAK